MTVIVVGGGLGGLAAAIAAKQAGREVLVLERADAPTEVETGITLWPFAIAALDELGLGARIISRIGSPLERLVNLSSDGRRLSQVEVERHPSGAKAYDVDRAALQAELISALPPAQIRYGARCIGVDATETRATARLDTGEVQGKILIGADGVHSVVRRHVAPEVKPNSPEVGVWRGTLDLDERVVPFGFHFRVYGAAGVFGVARLDDRRVRFYAGGRLRPNERPDRHALGSRFGSWCEPAATVISASTEKELLFNDTPRISGLRHWIRGRVALLGDAAHASLPTLGASGGLALADAAALGSALERSRDDTDALRSYVDERQSIGRRVQWEAEAFGLLELSTRPWLARVRNRFFGPPFGTLQRRAIAHVARGAQRPLAADLLRPQAG